MSVSLKALYQNRALFAQYRQKFDNASTTVPCTKSSLIDGLGKLGNGNFKADYFFQELMNELETLDEALLTLRTKGFSLTKRHCVDLDVATVENAVSTDASDERFQLRFYKKKLQASNNLGRICLPIE